MCIASAPFGLFYAVAVFFAAVTADIDRRFNAFFSFDHPNHEQYQNHRHCNPYYRFHVISTSI